MMLRRYHKIEEPEPVPEEVQEPQEPESVPEEVQEPEVEQKKSGKKGR